MKPPCALFSNPYNFQIPNPRVSRYKCQCIFLQLCTRSMCMLPALCFCCSFSEVIDTMMVFKRWAPGVMCVWCRGPDGPSEGYREAKGNWGRALLCFARQHRADHRHWPWPVGTIGWITYSPTACTEQRSGTDMCVCVWWWDTDPFTYPSTDYETIIDSDSPSPTGWPTTSASQIQKKKNLMFIGPCIVVIVEE